MSKAFDDLQDTINFSGHVYRLIPEESLDQLLEVRPYPPMRDDEFTKVSGKDAALINAHCMAMRSSIAELEAERAKHRALAEAAGEAAVALSEIVDQQSALRSGGPDPTDLVGLSENLDAAVTIADGAYDALRTAIVASEEALDE